jgi:hypothetical protein
MASMKLAATTPMECAMLYWLRELIASGELASISDIDNKLFCLFPSRDFQASAESQETFSSSRSLRFRV